MYAELKPKCPVCKKPHTYKTKWCKRCLDTRKRYREAHPEKILDIKLKSLYGISLEEYMKKNSCQDGLCAICGKPNNRINPRTKKPERLVVDHDHITKEVRDLLCHRCNLAVGIYETMKNQLENYLSKFKKLG